MAARYYVVGALLVVLGVLALAASNQMSDWMTVTPVHSVLYLGSGLCAGVAASRGLGTMRLCGKVLGFAYLTVTIAAVVMEGGNGAWLHLALALFFLYHALLAPPTP
jgi:hypothetical protein